MWGGSSRVVALFPIKWDLTGVVASVEEVMLMCRDVTSIYSGQATFYCFRALSVGCACRWAKIGVYYIVSKKC